MADKPKDETPKENLSEEIAQKVRAQIIHGGAGYAQPPKETRFKKGQSGNPRGRPRGAPRDLSFSDQPILGAARRAATKKIKVREGDKIREVPGFEALVESIFAYAMKGNARYGGYALDLTRIAEQAHAREVREQNEYWSTYQAVARQAIAEVQANGEAEPEVLPHPDDIIIDWKNGPRFIGPFDNDELKKFLETQRLCNVLLMQDVLDRRSSVRLDGTPLKEPGGALLFAQVLDDALPPRLRMGDGDMWTKQWRFERMTKRELLKSLYSEWRSIGRPQPRGFVFWDLSTTKKNLHFVFDFARQAQAGALDVATMANGEFDAAAWAFMEGHGIAIE